MAIVFDEMDRAFGVTKSSKLIDIAGEASAETEKAFQLYDAGKQLRWCQNPRLRTTVTARSRFRSGLPSRADSSSLVALRYVQSPARSWASKRKVRGMNKEQIAAREAAEHGRRGRRHKRRGRR